MRCKLARFVAACTVLLIGVSLIFLGISRSPTTQGSSQFNSGLASSATCPFCTSSAAHSPGYVHESGSSTPQPPRAPAPDEPAANLYSMLPPVGVFLIVVGVLLCIVPTSLVARLDRGRGLPIVLSSILLISTAGTILFNGTAVATSTITVSPARTAAYASDFAHGYTAGWFLQPGTSPTGTVYLTSDGGTKVLGASANSGGSVLVFYNGGMDWKNLSLTTTVKFVNGSVFYLNFRSQMTVANHSRYAVQFDLASGAVRLQKVIAPGTNPSTTTTLATTSYALSLNVWYTVGVIANLGSLGVSIGGATVVSATDPTPLAYGTIEFENDQAYGAYRIGSVTVSSTIPPQSTWQQLGGPDGGQIQVIDIDPFNTSIIYAGAVHTGVLKSDNKGDFWPRSASRMG